MNDLTDAISTALRGDDKYKRWPLGAMVEAQARIEALQVEVARMSATLLHLRGAYDCADVVDAALSSGTTEQKRTDNDQ